MTVNVRLENAMRWARKRVVDHALTIAILRAKHHTWDCDHLQMVDNQSEKNLKNAYGIPENKTPGGGL